MKINQLKWSLPLIALILLLNSCSHTPKQANYIPKDASYVVAINTYGIGKKVAWSSITGSKLIEDLKKQSKDPKKSDILNDLENAGIDWMSKLYAYYSPNDNKGGSMVALLPLKDEAQWEKFITKTFPESKIIDQKNRKSAFIMQGQALASWNKDIIIVIDVVNKAQNFDYNNPDLLKDTTALKALLNGPKPDEEATQVAMEKAFSISNENSIVQNDNFLNFDKEAHDIAVFMNYEKAYAPLLKQAGNINLNFDKFLKNASNAIGFDFEKGKIDLVMKGCPGDSLKEVMKEFAKDNFDASMFDKISGENLNGLLGYHISFNAFKMIAEKFGLLGMANLGLMQKNLTFDDIIGALTGDILMAVNNLRFEKNTQEIDLGNGKKQAYSSNSPNMDYTLALKIKDKTKLNKLLQLLNEIPNIKQTGNSYTIDGKSTLIVNDQYLVIGSRAILAQNFIQGKPKTSVSSEIIADINNHPVGLFLDLKSISNNIPIDFESPMDSSIAITAKELLTDVKIKGGEMKSNYYTTNGILNFTNKNENSLLLIMNFIQKLNEAKMANK